MYKYTNTTYEHVIIITISYMLDILNIKGSVGHLMVSWDCVDFFSLNNLFCLGNCGSAFIELLVANDGDTEFQVCGCIFVSFSIVFCVCVCVCVCV